MARAVSLFLALACTLPAQPDQWSEFVSKADLDLAFPNVVLNDAGQGMLSDFRGRSLVVVLIGFDSHAEYWMEAERLLRRGSNLAERGLDVVLWLNDASLGGDRDAQVFARMPWFSGLVVSGAVAFTAAPQYWMILADGTVGGRLMNQRDQQPDGWLNRFLNPGITSARRILAGWGLTGIQRQVRRFAYGRGQLARARTLLLARPDPDDRDELMSEIDELFARRLRHIRHDIEEGHLARARSNATALVDDVKGWAPKEDIAYEALRSLRSPAVEVELEFERHVERWLKGVRAGQPSEGDASRLEALIRTSPEGPVRERTRRLLDLVRRAAKVKSRD